MKSWRLLLERGLLQGAGLVLAVFIALPIAALFLTATPSELGAGLGHEAVWPALSLSLYTSWLSTVLIVVFGAPLAWSLARATGPLARAVEIAAQLPSVVPPAVAGVALLLAFGRRGLLASWLGSDDWSPAFTTAAVVFAQVFVSAPFFLQAAISAFRRIDPTLLVAARSFGAAPLRVFFWIAAPLAAPALLSGAAMSWARALGEFGATLMFAGNLEGRTQTLPLAIYTVLESDLRAAQALSIVLVVVALLVLALVRAAEARARAERAER